MILTKPPSIPPLIKGGHKGVRNKEVNRRIKILNNKFIM